MRLGKILDLAVAKGAKRDSDSDILSVALDVAAVVAAMMRS